MLTLKGRVTRISRTERESETYVHVSLSLPELNCLSTDLSTNEWDSLNAKIGDEITIQMELA